jgi:protein-S-isoprenylcysteine O-methyltransferase Ste14
VIEPVLDWLATPMSGSSTHQIAGWASWHARLMVLSWGILLPLGSFTARFYKVLPQQDWPRQLDNKTWWHTHRWLQSLAVVFMTLGLVLAYGAGLGDGVAVWLHVGFGWFLCIIGWSQVVVGLLRGSKGGPTDTQMRGDHYDMSRWRLWFERLHKGLGWLAVVVAVPTIGLGLTVSDAPRWMATVLVFWWLALGVWFFRMQRCGRCIDTYQAIWGPDAVHPGNRIAPVGWGVRRYTTQSWRARPRTPTTQSH